MSWVRLSSSCHPSDKIIHLPVYTATICVRFEFFFFFNSVLSPCAVDKVPVYVTLINTRSMKSPTPSRLCLSSSLFLSPLCDTVSQMWSASWTSRFLDAFAKLRKAIICYVISVRLSAWNDLAPTWRIFTKFGIWVLSFSPTYALIYIIKILPQAVTLVARFTPTCFDPYGSSSGSTAGPC